jgi:hypothetical protein
MKRSFYLEGLISLQMKVSFRVAPGKTWKEIANQSIIFAGYSGEQCKDIRFKNKCMVKEKVFR